MITKEYLKKLEILAICKSYLPTGGDIDQEINLEENECW